MTTTPLERKVRQLDNDVQALYELIHKVSTTQIRHSNRFDEITADLAAHGERLDKREGRFDGLVGKLDGLAGTLESVEGKVDGVESKLDKVVDLLQQR